MALKAASHGPNLSFDPSVSDDAFAAERIGLRSAQPSLAQHRSLCRSRTGGVRRKVLKSAKVKELPVRYGVTKLIELGPAAFL